MNARLSSVKRTMASLKRRSDRATVSGKSSGGAKYAAIALEHGTTHDREFEQWANRVWNYGSDAGSRDALKDLRRSIVVEVVDEAGQPALRFRVRRCWVSEF